MTWNKLWPVVFAIQNQPRLFFLFLLLKQWVFLVQPTERSHHFKAPWEHEPVNLLISSYLNPELINFSFCVVALRHRAEKPTRQWVWLRGKIDDIIEF